MRVIIPFSLDTWPDPHRSFFARSLAWLGIRLVRLLARAGIRAKRTEPVVLSVSEIRNEIFAASQGVWQARATGRLLTRIFHESISELFRQGPRNWLKSLNPTDLAEAGPLERHMYEYFIAPRLTRYQGALKESTVEVLQFWAAVKEWCEWFRRIVKGGLESGYIQYD